MKPLAGMVASTILCGLAISSLHAQNIEDMVSKYTEANGEGYLQPLADAVGANLNSGLFQTARIPTTGFYIRGNLVVMLAPIGDDNKTFTATTEPPFSPTQTAEAPTVFGDTDPVSVIGTGGTEYVFPGGFAINRFPFLVPHIAIGSIRGTEVMFRYFQLTPDDNIGKIKLFGFGARHSISQYLEEPPLDLSASFFFQTFDIGDIVEANTTIFGLQGSYTKSVLTLYGGPGIETSSLDIAYDFEDTQIRFNMDGENSFRFTAGASADLLILRLFIEYNFASQSALALGIGLGSVI